MLPRPYVGFISYSRRYEEWVLDLHSNLEKCLSYAGRAERVFLDQVDLGSGRSWVSQLQAGIEQAESFILVATPEALASPRVADEWESFLTVRPDWRFGNLHIVHLVEVPLPPFLAGVQQVDFRAHDEAKYRRSLQELVAGLLGAVDRRRLPELPPDLEAPPPPEPGLPDELRRKLVDWLAPMLASRVYRRAIAAGLGLEHTALETYPSWSNAASAAIVRATGDDDAVKAALRIVDVLREELAEDKADLVRALDPLRNELEALGRTAPERGLVRLYLAAVEKDHSTLVPYFRREDGFELLDRIYVRLELQPEKLATASTESIPRDLRELLLLDPREQGWITRRWIVRGDPGAGKTTLLRHLASRLGAEADPPWIPVFDTLPRLMREREWLLDRIARRLERAGHPARGLSAALDRAGHAGELLLLLDGLDEVPREDRQDAETLLRDFSARWPETPLVVTTRPIGYRKPGGEFVELELLPFDPDHRSEFLARWFGRSTGIPDPRRASRVLADLEQDFRLRELAGNPLYLTLMALLLEQGHAPERNRTRLYDQVFDLLLEGKHRPMGEPIEYREAVRGILRYLGYEMTRANLDSEPVGLLEGRLYEPVADTLRQPLERVPRWRRSMRPFLDDLAERTGILGPHDGPDADWRFWHRTFREALAAEQLEQMAARQGTDSLLAHAREIAGDESRWAEPYALLAGRVDDPDGLVRALVRVNRSLGLRALATAQGVGDSTLSELLELSASWSSRASVYRRLPELLDDPERALALLDQLRRRTRNGNDLYFLDQAAQSVGLRWSEWSRQAEHLRLRLYDHIPPPPEELFCHARAGRDGEPPLWAEIPDGEFLMGTVATSGSPLERPAHRVVVASPFWIGRTLVTNRQYAAFDIDHENVAGIASDGGLPDRPVVGVSWFEAVSFCRWLSSGAEWARGARLPLEEEWEYACRAGTETRFWSGDTEESLTSAGWHRGNSGHRVHQVGELEANPWGLYDMHGNVWEWTASPMTNGYSRHRHGRRIDSKTPLSQDGSQSVVVRGGSSLMPPERARSACRGVGELDNSYPDVGFRVLLGAPPSRSSTNPAPSRRR